MSNFRKKTVFIVVLLVLSLFTVSAKGNFYFSAGPELGATGQSIQSSSSLMTYVGARARIGLCSNSKYLYFLSADASKTNLVSSYSAFSAVPDGYCFNLSGGFGFCLNGLNLLFDAGAGLLNTSKTIANPFLLAHFGFTLQVPIVHKNNNALVASIPFTYCFSKNVRSFSAGLSVSYEYGASK